MQLSHFGKRFSGTSGIGQLMDDLGNALADGGNDMLMLGGGNPGHIPAVQARFRTRMQELMTDGREFEQAIGNYDAPRGEKRFVNELAALLRREYGWAVTERNIALTNGSQTAFFLLFNMFAGAGPTGTRRILLPLAPEYIGYADLGLDDGLFQANRPGIQELDDGMFKYHVDFNTLTVDDSTAAICVSRPTNPTGNVITDEEVQRLKALANARNIPLIIDNAYGLPFPGIIYTEATPTWDDSMVMCMSLSKLGLPGTRTGIVIANEEICSAISNMNAVLSLAPGSLGVALAYDLVKSGEIVRLGSEIIKPYYERKAQAAYQRLRSRLPADRVRIHKPEGAMFLWLWFQDLPISDQELYERLKARKVLVVPGHHFFHALDKPWQHAHECIRVTYAQDDAVVEQGLDIIADEITRIYAS